MDADGKGLEMDFNVLKYYVSVVKNLSFLKAAVECHSLLFTKIK